MDVIVLPPKVFAYYLPAFLISITANQEIVDTFHETLLSLLSPPEADDRLWSSLFPKIVTELTREQSAVIFQLYRDYAELFPDSDWPIIPVDHEDRARALDFWKEKAEIE